MLAGRIGLRVPFALPRQLRVCGARSDGRRPAPGARNFQRAVVRLAWPLARSTGLATSQACSARSSHSQASSTSEGIWVLPSTCPKRFLGARESDSHSLSITRQGWAGPPEAATCIRKLTNLRSYRTSPRRRGAKKSTKPMGGDAMNRPRAADDFATIRARLEELRREREAAQAPARNLPPEPPQRYTRYAYGSQREISPEPGQVRQSGPTRS
jgi:hypothetical protein